MEDRFWDSTKGRIVRLLLREKRTVNELAEALRITDNAVRAALTSLERDGLVRQTGSRPGKRKPNLLYDLTAKAKQLFPKAYGLLLRNLLDVLQEQLSQKKLEATLRMVGHRLASLYAPAFHAQGSVRSTERAIALLREFGGFCERQGGNGQLLLVCFECPFAEVTVGRREVCLLLETVLEDVLGVPVRERCEQDPRPRCRFEIGNDTA